MFWLVTLAVIAVVLALLGWYDRHHRIDPGRVHRALGVRDSRDYGPGGSAGGGGGAGSGD